MDSSKTNISLIIEGCLKNNPISQKKLFELQYGFVKSICNRYSATEAESKEMLNDTFYNLFKFIDRYDQQMAFQPWLKKVCINCCLQHKRKYYKNPRFFEINEDHQSALSVDFELPSTEEKDYMALLTKLPPACKTVLILFVIEEYKHQEIAELLRISVGSSKSNLARAKRILHQVLEKDMKSNLKLKSNNNG